MCLSLSEGHTCAYGSCVNNSCVCNPGFQQNVEFYYGEVPTDTIIFCNYHPKAMLTFSCCLLIFTIAVTAAHVITARSRRHVRVIEASVAKELRAQIKDCFLVQTLDSNASWVFLVHSLANNSDS